VSAFVVGSANMIAATGVPREICIIIMGVFVASFAGTTLDTATRIQRYVITELASDLKIRGLQNRYTATAVAVVSAALLAFYNGASGQGALLLWPLFGTINQLLAGLSLIIVTYYLRRVGAHYIVTLVPAVLVLGFTSWAMVLTLGDLYTSGNAPSLIIGAIAAVLELWMIVEGFTLIARYQKPVAGEASADD
jgi:carbon starvation protein